MSYTPLPVEETGGQKRIRSADDNTHELLKMFLTELRIMNLNLSVMTDNVFDSKDVETP